MATVAETHTNQGGYSRLAINQIGIWMFFLSETFLFGALISTRFYLQGFETPEHVDQVLGLGRCHSSVTTGVFGGHSIPLINYFPVGHYCISSA